MAIVGVCLLKRRGVGEAKQISGQLVALLLDQAKSNVLQSAISFGGLIRKHGTPEQITEFHAAGIDHIARVGEVFQINFERITNVEGITNNSVLLANIQISSRNGAFAADKGNFALH